ncbi:MULTISPECIES: MarR family winged helix-turn-helix transcriptional regulator [unclassified Arthrobacter]|uniref:MarR family winged helix-turn-helix transcriptional regulator n=1 Tax=unclassified Arthrobacter TaxID=235627 RepID=UPI002DF8C4E2|nr:MULTISPECIES: MarR family transcriptional regulator [unclassified Arthrobacter]MEC5191232.1 DNA-binding MarR family transcriptional regulator [Arthrobacter sp. MP_M4]MEC5202529.1 DNA-binding MarR family transcriptional regulator [Arthrobacter sp. MP_M7]
MNEQKPAGSGYWYGPDDRLDPPGAVLQALRDYRNVEVARRRSTRDSMGMGETDLLALRYLLRAQAGGGRVGPKDLSRMLGITTASTTSLIDRLVGTGHVRREPHPTDRRSLVIVPTAATDVEVRATLGSLHQRMMAVAESLTADEARIVVSFLQRMGEAMTEPRSVPEG